MNLKSLKSRLSEIEQHTHSAVFSLDQARILFPDESDQVLLNSLVRHTRTEMLRKVATGVWLNPHSAYLSKGNLLHQVAALLRRSEFNYVSLETVLSEASVISQQMQGYLTVMTTGRKQTYKTALGTIEFTHTQRDPRKLLDETFEVPESALRRATIARAWADLKRVGRNTEMVNQAELSAALAQEKEISGLTRYAATPRPGAANATN